MRPNNNCVQLAGVLRVNFAVDRTKMPLQGHSESRLSTLRGRLSDMPSEPVRNGIIVQRSDLYGSSGHDSHYLRAQRGN